MKLYSYNQDCGRMGDLEGLFVASDSDFEWFMNTSITEYDVLGKHSEIDIKFDKSTVRRQDVEDATVEDLFKTFGNAISGITPYNYDCEIEEEYGRTRDSGNQDSPEPDHKPKSRRKEPLPSK